MFCDLHTHSTASDGTTAPAALARLGQAAGLAALALTDHDTTAGVAACAAACAALGLAFVPGIELSTDPHLESPAAARPTGEDPPRHGTLHLLGYRIRPDDGQLLAVQAQLRQARQERNPRIVGRLNELGVRLDYEEVLALAQREAGGGADSRRIVGRPHIAAALVAKGYARSVQDAFNRYLAQGRPAYVRKDQLPAGAAIGAIHAAGGLAVLAHPVQLRLPDAAALEHFVKQLTELGLDGIETRHSDHTPAEVEHFERLARRFGLLTTGGSDFHGARKDIALGSQRVPLEVFQRLMAHQAGS